MAVTSVIGKQIINVDNDTNYYFVVAPQGDSQSRFVEVTLTTNGGTPYNIPGNATIMLEGKNAGGYNIFNSCIREAADKITIPLTNGVLTFAGVGKYCVAIYSGTTSILSFPFNIVVTEAPYDVSAVIGSDVYEALNEVIAKAADSNNWLVGDDDPHINPTCPPDTHAGDYYLNALNGEIFIAKFDTATSTMIWDPLMNSLTGDQLNIMSKTYVRYASDASGSDFSDDPTAGGITRKFIGFLSTVNVWDPTDPSQDINIPSNYTWASMSTGIKTTECWYLFLDEYVPSPPNNSYPWSPNWPTNITPGGYLWIKTKITFTDNTVAEYYTVAKNGRGVDHIELLKDEGDISNGEKVFRFIYDETGYYVTSTTGVTESPHDLGWYEYDGTSYTITSDTSVQSGKTYYTKGRQSDPISVFNGTDAGFAEHAVTASVQHTPGVSSVTVTESGTVINKAFDLAFRMRGSEFKSGTDISGTTPQTSTVLTSADTVIGDIYINESTKQSFICSAVNATSSTWEPSIIFDSITYVEDLKNTRRYYEDLTPDIVAAGGYIDIEGNDAIFSAFDAYDDDTYYYHIKYLTALPGIAPTKPEPVVITNGHISSRLYFKNTRMQDIKVTPVGTENPHSKGWYEKSGNTYVVTSDTSVVPNKDYYQKVEICMEVIKKLQ